MSKLEAKTRRMVNRSLGKLGLMFHETPGLALTAVLDVLQTEGLSFGMTYQPKTGTTRNTVLRGEVEVANSLLVVQTHEMEVTGRVELNCYLS